MRGDGLVAWLIDEPLQLTPASLEAGRFVRALIVDVVDVLDDGLSRMQHVRVRHMVHEQDQIVWTRGQRLVDGSNRRRVLADEPCASGDRPIHPDALPVGPVPLAPAVSLRRLDAWSVVRARDV